MITLSKLVEDVKDKVVSPGELLNDALVNKKVVTVKYFADESGLSFSELFKILHKDEPIDEGVAETLGKITDVDAKTWLEMQAEYNEANNQN